MMDRRDVEAIVEAVSSVMREAQAKMSERLSAIEKKLSEVEQLALIQPKEGPAGKDGRDGVDAVPAELIASMAAALVPMPANGRDGADGKDGAAGPAGKDADENVIVNRVLSALPPVPSVINVSANVDEIVAEVLSKIPKAKEIDEEQIAQRVWEKIPAVDYEVIADRAATLIPAVKDGRDANEDEIVQRVLATIPSLEVIANKAASLIPTPKDGRDGKDGVDGKDGKDGLSEIIRMPLEDNEIQIIAKQAALLIPPAKDGKDGVDGKDVNEEKLFQRLVVQIPTLETIANRAASLIPTPKDGRDGRDADEAVLLAALERQLPSINEVAQAAVAFIPVPKDGRDADETKIFDKVLSVLKTQVEELRREIPKPEEVDYQRVISSVLAVIPKPQDGRSVTVDDCRELISEAVTRAVSELPAAKDGRDGADGAAGPQGPAGAAGESVHPDTIQIMIRRALDEEIARLPRAIDGVDGKDGESVHPDTVKLLVTQAVADAVATIPPAPAGRDALQIEILPAIDPMKSYPARTYARHDGGTWMSQKQTSIGETLDLSEWLCVWDNVVVSVEQHEDLRTFSVKRRHSGGHVEVNQFKIPCVLYRGGYKNGETYEQGDSVSRDGSQWICQVASTTTVPGFSTDWRMSVRKGDSAKENKQQSPNGNKPISLA